MLITVRRFAALVVLAGLPLGGCASAYEGPIPYEGPTSAYSEVLSELPADAPPGECYAKVVVPGQRIEAPPATQGAVWVISQTAAGPVYCLVPTGPAIQPVAETISRYGWIRVLCDQDATPERITRVQNRLHERGYYRGQVSGRYDRETAQAVARFQSGAHIDHGGYLSLETLQALDVQGSYASAQVVVQQAAPIVAPPIVAQAPVSYGYAEAYSYQQQAPVTYAYAPPPAPIAAPCNCAQAYAPPPQVYYQQTYAAPPPQAYPCCAAPPPYAASGYGYGPPAPAYASAQAQAYAGGGYASAHASVRVVQNGWLMWNGKSGF